MARLLLDGFAVPDPADYDALAAIAPRVDHPFRGTLMMMKRLLLAVAFAALPLLAAAQPYPAKPIRIVVPFPPGGPTDVLGAHRRRRHRRGVRQPVVVENKSGAAGNIGVDLVAKAAPDGYTLTWCRSATSRSIRRCIRSCRTSVGPRAGDDAGDGGEHAGRQCGRGAGAHAEGAARARCAEARPRSTTRRRAPAARRTSRANC